VLTVAKIIGSQAAGYADYLAGKSTTSQLGDYYLRDGERVEAPGRWVSGATQVGADSKLVVEAAQLQDLMAVRYPGTDRSLRRVGGSGEAVAALDATFSAPKSVSAIWAVADPDLREAIETVHEGAVNAAVYYSVEKVAMVRERVSSDTVVHRKATDLIATSWRHSTARAVPGRLPDPQLHSHVLLHAAVRRDGRVVAIDSRAWFVHRREVGAAYRTELARGMAELGFQIRRGTGRGQRYFEIEGVPQCLLDRWSSRTDQIQEAIDANLTAKQDRLRERITAGGPEAEVAQKQLRTLQASGQLTAKEDRLLRVSTRSVKNPAISHADLDQAWMSTGRDHGLDAAGLSELCDGAGEGLPALDRQQMMAALVQFEPTFLARDGRAVALEQSAGASIHDTLSVLRGMWLDGKVILLADGTHTTTSHRVLEADVLDVAERLTENEIAAIPLSHVRASATDIDDKLKATGGQLAAEQRQALKLATAERQLVMIEGQAGTGKSTVLQAVALAHQAAGRQVIVTSTAGLAAQRLTNDLNEVGVTATGYSTAALIHAIEAGRLELDPESTVIHDEAALASTREQSALLQAVEGSGARLIMVGDPAQSKPVGAGGLWRHIESQVKDGGAHVELTQNLRARQLEDRRDQQQFRNGHHVEAIGSYGERGRVHLTADSSGAEDLALEGAQADRVAGRKTIVIAQTSNDHLDELNARAQALRQQAGELGRDGVSVPGRPYELHRGDEVQIRRNMVHPGSRRLRNGTAAQIAAVNDEAGTARLRFADQTEVDIDRAQLQAADVRLSYVQHPFPAQGVTTDTAHLIVGEHASAEGSFVAITRPRDEAHIYAGQDRLENAEAESELERLAVVMGREEPEIPSIAIPLAQAPDQTTPKPALEPDWQRSLGRPPADERQAERWEKTVADVAAYRDRYDIPDTDTALLGTPPAPGAFRQRLERRRIADQAREIIPDSIEPETAMDRGPLRTTPDMGLEP
jgi:conjugative relaxase-like TrwC/TraI family protein